MKIYELEVGGKVVAYSKHLDMLKLYLVQRHLEKSNFRIQTRKVGKGDYVNPDLLLYVIGTFVLTSFEYEYIQTIGNEHRTYIENLVVGLELIAGDKTANLSKRDLKAIKRTIQYLNKHISFDKEESSHILDTIVDHPHVVDEYMAQVKFIRDVLRGEC